MFGYQGQLSEPKGEDLIGIECRPKLSANEDTNKKYIEMSPGVYYQSRMFF